MSRTGTRRPFGAAWLGDGRARFRLFAPAARLVSLVLDSGDTPMTRGRDGFYETVIDDIGPGVRYAYRIDGGAVVPDPASRFQPEDVHGPSELLDPDAFAWNDGGWTGRPWEDAVLYELHVGSFSPEGTYDGVRRRLDHLTALGVTALELMPVSDFPGARNWGYDGVLPFAPDARYGRPEDLMRLVDAAHGRGLMVFLDVVYNHFGPEGNYLHLYAPCFFNARHETPWGAAINFDGPGAAPVRAFFVANVLYWLEAYHLDGLRFDAVHAIHDGSSPNILEEIAAHVAAGPGRHRRIHLVLENDRNEARYLRPAGSGDPPYRAQWNDDAHHVLHVAATGDATGYYADYADRVPARLGRALAEGFIYQGEPSAFRGGARRGESTEGLSPTAFVHFLQNHDQIGNRAFGERLDRLVPPARLRALTAILLLSPSPPLLFMGQEWAAATPFLFFCDFGPELARTVTEGRRREFARFPEFSDPALRQRIPDPNAEATFEASRLRWEELARAPGRDWLAFHRRLLALRHRELTPRLRGTGPGRASIGSDAVTTVTWRLGDGTRLHLCANLSDRVPASAPPVPGRILWPAPGEGGEPRPGEPWTVVVSLDEETAS